MVAARKQMADGKSQPADSTSEKPAGGEGRRHSNYNYDEAVVLKVQEWNEALKCTFLSSILLFKQAQRSPKID